MRFRMYPTEAQAAAMATHCAHARFVWNLALEQANCYRQRFGPTPGHLERNRQLTEARSAFDWLAAGSQMVQQQALRDFDQAMQCWWRGSHRHPTWRKAGRHEGFRVVAIKPAHVQRLNRRWAQVLVPKVGWVRFRWTRTVPPTVRSYRVNRDASGRWHVAFAYEPGRVAGPGDGSIVGIDRGIARTVCLDTGEHSSAPRPDWRRRSRLQARIARQQQGSQRRERAKRQHARLLAREADQRKDWAEKATTDIARRFDVVVVEDLRVRSMVRSARGTGRNVRAKTGLNRSIQSQAWGRFARRLGDKVGDRLLVVNAAYTSQTCSTCGHRCKDSRESQAKFVCRACGIVEHADVNAARNISAAGRAVAGRGAIPQTEPHAAGALASNRQPQLAGFG